MRGWRCGPVACDVAFLSLTESELTKVESTYLAEMHRQSPKEKASKPPTVRRRKRPHAHLRVPHLEEVMSPVTTPTDEDVGHRIKHVAGVCGGDGWAVSGSPHACAVCALVRVYMVYNVHVARELEGAGCTSCSQLPLEFLGPCRTHRSAWLNSIAFGFPPPHCLRSTPP